MNKSIIFGLVFLLMISSAAATCTVTITRTLVYKGETVVASMACDAVNEKSQAYTLNWTNATGYVLESDTGTTPAVAGQVFTQSYTVPNSWNYGNILNATLTGTNLEGTDWLNVSSAGINSLLITNVVNGGKWIGLTSSTTAEITDENGKKITGGMCNIYLTNNLGTQTLFTQEQKMFNGKVNFVGVADYVSFQEGVDYTPYITCSCGHNNTETACIDEDGNVVADSVGYTLSSFTMNKWVDFSSADMRIAYSNGTYFPNATLYAGYGNRVYWYSNKTNNYAAELTVKSKQFLINNETRLTTFTTTEDFTINNGNNSMLRLHDIEIPSSTPTGLYYVRQYFDVYYQNILVSQYITATETFNVTGTSNSFQLHNVVMDKTDYYTGEVMNICGNITSNYNSRVEFEISYRYRCGGSLSTSLAAIDSYTEIRGVNPNANQLRCSELLIPYSELLAYKNSSCQAIVTVKSDYINTFDNKITLQGPLFTITDFGMYPDYEKDASYPIVRLFPDWRRFDTRVDNISRSYYRAKINISQINETKLDAANVITDNDWDVYAIFTDNMPCSTDIYNYSVEYANGTIVTAHTIENKALQWVERDGTEKKACALGIENVNFSDVNDDYFVVKVWYEDFTERQTNAMENQTNYQAYLAFLSNLTNTEYLKNLTYNQYLSYLINMTSLTNSSNVAAQALQTIANKTGSFHMSINCSDTTTASVACIIEAYNEFGGAEKEVQFECNIEGESPVSWLSKVNSSIYTSTQNFNLENLSNGVHTASCKAYYYDLGIQAISFSDSFSMGITYGGSGSAGNNLINILSNEFPFISYPAEKAEAIKKEIRDNTWILVIIALGVFAARKQMNSEELKRGQK